MVIPLFCTFFLVFPFVRNFNGCVARSIIVIVILSRNFSIDQCLCPLLSSLKLFFFFFFFLCKVSFICQFSAQYFFFFYSLAFFTFFVILRFFWMTSPHWYLSFPDCSFISGVFSGFGVFTHCLSCKIEKRFSAILNVFFFFHLNNFVIFCTTNQVNMCVCNHNILFYLSVEMAF